MERDSQGRKHSRRNRKVLAYQGLIHDLHSVTRLQCWYFRRPYIKGFPFVAAGEKYSCFGSVIIAFAFQVMIKEIEFYLLKIISGIVVKIVRAKMAPVFAFPCSMRPRAKYEAVIVSLFCFQ